MTVAVVMMLLVVLVHWRMVNWLLLYVDTVYVYIFVWFG